MPASESNQEVWQEFECPRTGTDFDLFGAEMRLPDEAIACSACGREHRACDVAQMLVSADDDEPKVVPVSEWHRYIKRG